MKVTVSAAGNRIIELEHDDVALVLGEGQQCHEARCDGPVVYLGLNPAFEDILIRRADGVLSTSIVYMKSLHALSADPQFRASVTRLGARSIGLEVVSIS